FSPVPPLRLDASTRSLEPKNSRAGDALQRILHKMPVRWEPLLAIVRAQDRQQLHDEWRSVSAHWSALQIAGIIKGFSTPAALCLSPTLIETNRERLRTVDLQAARQALEATLDTEEFSRDAFAPAFALLEDLQRTLDPHSSLPDWRDRLPKNSS